MIPTQQIMQQTYFKAYFYTCLDFECLLCTNSGIIVVSNFRNLGLSSRPCQNGEPRGSASAVRLGAPSRSPHREAAGRAPLTVGESRSHDGVATPCAPTLLFSPQEPSTGSTSSSSGAGVASGRRYAHERSREDACSHHHRVGRCWWSAPLRGSPVTDMRALSASASRETPAHPLGASGGWGGG